MADPLSFPETHADFRLRLAKRLADAGFPRPEIDAIIAYADDLASRRVPVILDQGHLAALVGYDLDYLQVMSTCKEDFYKEYRIPKRRGGWRIIDQPLPNLMDAQRWILDSILMSPGALERVSPAATAFMPGRDIIDNAKLHVGKKTVICLDLKDFFPGVKWMQVYALFKALGYRRDVAGMLSHLCTLRGALPQGAPTSPMLSNMIMAQADSSIAAHCSKKAITYTRYADDLTFSFNDPHDYGRLMGYVTTVMANKGFIINRDKTKVFHRNHSQAVTGIVVNEFPQAPRRYRRKIRQEMHYIETRGLRDHLTRIATRFTPEAYLNHLLGKIRHVIHINPADREMLAYRHRLTTLISSLPSSH